VNFIRFYEELNYFIDKKQYKKEIEFEYRKNRTVKNIIEAFGVPHTEVDLVLVNSKSVSFDYVVKDRERISVYPVYESFNIKEVSKVRPFPLRKLKFILDVHLGRLAKFLRLCGFDTLYRNDFSDDEIACISVNEKRIILTRDRALLKRKKVTHGYYVRSQNVVEQLKEIIRRFQLENEIREFSLCPECNSKIVTAEKEKIKNQVPEYIYKKYDQFKYCSKCKKVYWKGSHWINIKKVIKINL
jgi:uncharacterized protein